MNGDSIYSMGKWRSKLLITSLIVCIIISVTEYIFYIVNDDAFKALYGGSLIYFVRFFLIPTAVFALVLGFARMANHSVRLSERAKNFCVSFAFLTVCVVTECVHGYYAPLLCASCVAIFVTTIFADKALTLLTTVIAYAALLGATAMAYFESRQNDDRLISDFAVAAVITFCSYLAAKLLMANSKEQLDSLRGDYRKQQELLEELKIEPLTGLHNRRFLNEYLDGAFNHSLAGDDKLCVAMLDIDDFKQVNDQKGHKAGDSVLVTLSEIVKSCVSGKAKAFRYGGEEFAVIFSDGKLTGAYDALERIRSTFQQEMQLAYPDLKVTVSAGLCQMNKDIESAQVWLANADKALYQAKKDGKNKTVIFREEKSENL